MTINSKILENPQAAKAILGFTSANIKSQYATGESANIVAKDVELYNKQFIDNFNGLKTAVLESVTDSTNGTPNEDEVRDMHLVVDFAGKGLRRQGVHEEKLAEAKEALAEAEAPKEPDTAKVATARQQISFQERCLKSFSTVAEKMQELSNQMIDAAKKQWSRNLQWFDELKQYAKEAMSLKPEEMADVMKKLGLQD